MVENTREWYPFLHVTICSLLRSSAIFVKNQFFRISVKSFHFFSGKMVYILGVTSINEIIVNKLKDCPGELVINHQTVSACPLCGMLCTKYSSVSVPVNIRARERGTERERQNDYAHNRSQWKQELKQSGLPRDLIFYYDHNNAKGNREVKQQHQKNSSSVRVWRSKINSKEYCFTGQRTGSSLRGSQETFFERYCHICNMLQSLK